MTALRIEVEGPCVVSLTCEPGGLVRLAIRQGEREIHVAEFDAGPRASVPAYGAASEEDEAFFDQAEGEFAESGCSAAALQGPRLLETARPRGQRRPPPAPRPREI